MFSWLLCQYLWWYWKLIILFLEPENVKFGRAKFIIFFTCQNTEKIFQNITFITLRQSYKNSNFINLISWPKSLLIWRRTSGTVLRFFKTNGLKIFSWSLVRRDIVSIKYSRDAQSVVRLPKMTRDGFTDGPWRPSYMPPTFPEIANSAN